jgi:uncharacterized protein YchJ
MIEVHGVHSSAFRNVYLVCFYLPNGACFDNVQVTDIDEDFVGFDALIGMDIMSNGDFAVTNTNGKTTFSFRVPPLKEIDFVEEAHSIQPKIGRNDPCPCKSGQKYKKCHGRGK